MTPTCMSCRGPLTQLADLGEHRISDFTPDRAGVPSYPLIVMRCDVCGLVQLHPEHRAPIGELYHERYSFKSGVSPAISADLADVVASTLQLRRKPDNWLDIASNDGTLLSHVPVEVRRVGVDPLAQFAAEARLHADEIHTAFFDPHLTGGELFDVVTSVSMFYDIPDPVSFATDVRNILAAGGVWVIQQNYLPAMMDNNSIDNISHEHLAYYDLAALENVLHHAGLEVFDVTTSTINGGCFRAFVARPGDYWIRPAVHAMRDREKTQPVDWPMFFETTAIQIDRLRTFVDREWAVGRRFAVYGASTRGGTIWQLAGLDGHRIEFVADRNPAKVGTWMTSIDAPIISEEQARHSRPDYMLVGPWWFRDQFIDRETAYLDAGGALVFPLPEFEIVASGRVALDRLSE